jgi:enterochelin esterase-like enzyme
MSKSEKTSLRRVTFRITTNAPLPVGEQVFIAGADPALGAWQANGFPLSRTADNTWTAIVALSSNQSHEFKITRGNWSNEEILEDESIPPNHIIPPGDDYVFEYNVHHWCDSRLAPPPKITGLYRIHESIHSDLLRFDRQVIVWLPPSYPEETDRRYPVLYMHDGQQIFDPQTSTWNQDWEVDEWCTRLIKAGELQEIIVVGVYCTEDRFQEYDPAQVGIDYALFMTEELKPFIDREYRTLPDPKNTAVAGSSMGGTISFYLAWQYPDIYSMTACLSPAFEFKDSDYDLAMVRESKKKPALDKIYLYCGEGDKLERELAPGMRQMADLLREKGFDKASLQVVEESAGQHNEATWARHTGDWLRFLFGITVA